MPRVTKVSIFVMFYGRKEVVAGGIGIYGRMGLGRRGLRHP
jgi:hypothetical protein